jgi:bifunctional UDP-N-acetylglucosamine pyrophosphorylase/glucosamine-1-phosphate N-acetyltransferase
MKSDKPKVLHEVGNKPMIGHVLDTARQSGCDQIAVVVGSQADDIRDYLATGYPDAAVVVQPTANGTGSAVIAALPVIERGFDDVIVLFADGPNIRTEDLTAARAAIAAGAAVSVIGFETNTPTGYGRLITQADHLLAIREERDSSPEEKALTYCNSGIICFSGRQLPTILSGIENNNAKSEYYLTDTVEIANGAGHHVAFSLAPAQSVGGVNSRAELAAAEAYFQQIRREQLLDSGVTMQLPETVFLSADTVVGADVTIEPHVVFGPNVSIGDHTRIYAFCHLTGCAIGTHCQIGPFARLRPNAKLSKGVKVGNFVELKNSEIAEGAKVNHLSYVGDSIVGEKANIGAGAITCNYDGQNKYKTHIGARAFVGSNSSLVAPITIGEGAIIGSGSVITDDVEGDALALGRARQTNKPSWATPFRERNKK